VTHLEYNVKRNIEPLNIRGGKVLQYFFFIQLNLFYSAHTTNYEFASAGFTICTHTTSQTQNFPSDQEKLPRNRKKTFIERKSEETFRRATEKQNNTV